MTPTPPYTPTDTPARIGQATAKNKVNTRKVETPAVRVAIIDSGAGGLSIAKTILAQQLNAELTYLADLKCFPYGLLSEEQLLKRIHLLVNHIDNDFAPDIYIIACNTASTLVLPTLRTQFTKPFIGVVPAIKPAAKASKSKHILVLATQATTERAYLDQLIHDYAEDVTVHKRGSQRLVQLAESFVRNKTVDEHSVKKEIDEIMENATNIDIVVLACTHFPILKPYIERHLSQHNIKTLDSTDAIISRLTTLEPEVMRTRSTGNHHMHLVNTASEALTHYADYLFDDDDAELQFSGNYAE